MSNFTSRTYVYFHLTFKNVYFSILSLKYMLNYLYDIQEQITKFN
jgi:hypothetical protein